MKRREHLMLKRAALASIQLEALPLVRVQAMADEELERTSGEILQRAHGRGQLATVKRLGNGGRPCRRYSRSNVRGRADDAGWGRGRRPGPRAGRAQSR